MHTGGVLRLAFCFLSHLLFHHLCQFSVFSINRQGCHIGVAGGDTTFVTTGDEGPARGGGLGSRGRGESFRGWMFPLMADSPRRPGLSERKLRAPGSH
ncbi:hypothetical protein B0T11DRAFT_88058 [Plectosphaerella cucumerina]|uniref:Secreted protein n=1 Tax=Plectosphaerella cucumerina TaxID=40658 RepID=A0A8K0X3L8_9PEZI|nr:hypothetical protein B0T11DRAFT_88058 [Plectosphaerella cucumerina]